MSDQQFHFWNLLLAIWPKFSQESKYIFFERSRSASSSSSMKRRVCSQFSSFVKVEIGNWQVLFSFVVVTLRNAQSRSTTFLLLLSRCTYVITMYYLDDYPSLSAVCVCEKNGTCKLVHLRNNLSLLNFVNPVKYAVKLKLLASLVLQGSILCVIRRKTIVSFNS